MGKLTGRNSAATRRNLDGINLGLSRSCSAGETSLREGEIITIDPLIGGGGVNIHQHLHQHHPIPNPSSCLVSKPQIGTCGLLVVLITPCS